MLLLWVSYKNIILKCTIVATNIKKRLALFLNSKIKDEHILIKGLLVFVFKDFSLTLLIM